MEAKIPNEIYKAFPSLSDKQRRQFAMLMELYPEWNSKINVISRKDIDNLEINHLLHALAIAKFIHFQPGSRILDFGCGGGIPGIPLAIMFPEVHFHLIDRIGKKIRVAQDISEKIGLINVSFQHGDIGECKEKFDFIVSRAVMPQTDLVSLSKKNISSEQRNPLPNGVITLKGGELQSELKPLAKSTELVPLSNFFDYPHFKDKYVIYTSVSPSKKSKG